MQNPWNTTEPFKAMMTDVVTLSGERPLSTSMSASLSCCIFPIENVEPFTAVDIDTDLELIKILALSCSQVPQVGDTITTKDNDKYSLTKVKKVQGWYDIEARSN